MLNKNNEINGIVNFFFLRTFLGNNDTNAFAYAFER